MYSYLRVVSHRYHATYFKRITRRDSVCVRSGRNLSMKQRYEYTSWPQKPPRSRRAAYYTGRLHECTPVQKTREGGRMKTREWVYFLHFLVRVYWSGGVAPANLQQYQHHTRYRAVKKCLFWHKKKTNMQLQYVQYYSPNNWKHWIMTCNKIDVSGNSIVTSHWKHWMTTFQQHGYVCKSLVETTTITTTTTTATTTATTTTTTTTTIYAGETTTTTI